MFDIRLEGTEAPFESVEAIGKLRRLNGYFTPQKL